MFFYNAQIPAKLYHCTTQSDMQNANIALLILYLSARWGEWSVNASAAQYPVESLPVTIKYMI